MRDDDCYTASDTVEAMRRGDRALVVFRPTEWFPNEIAPRPLLGWKLVSGDGGTLLYVNIAGERRAVAWLNAQP